MPKNTNGYWGFVNAVGKVIGCGFVLVGTILAMWGIKTIIGTSRYDSTEITIVILSAIVVIVLGVLLLMARPYRPNEEKNKITQK
jgi:heme/copper-type cytochrome/quinol oxidase subunit 2